MKSGIKLRNYKNRKYAAASPNTAKKVRPSGSPKTFAHAQDFFYAGNVRRNVRVQKLQKSILTLSSGIGRIKNPLDFGKK